MQTVRLTGFSDQQQTIASWKFRRLRMLTWIGRRSRAEYSRLSSAETRGRSPCCCRCVLIPETARALLILSDSDQAVPGMKASLDDLREELRSRGIETNETCVAPNLTQLMVALDTLLLPPMPSLLLVVVVARVVDLAPMMVRVSNHVPLSVGMLLSRISSANVPKIVVLDCADGLVQMSPDLLQKSPDVYLMIGGRARRSTDSSTCLSGVSPASTASGDREPNTAIDDAVFDEDDDDDSKHFVAGAPSETGFIIGHARGRAGHLVADECDSRNPTYSMVDDILAELRAHPTNRQPLYLDVLLGGVVRRSTGSVPYAMSSMRRVVAIPPRREDV